MLLRAENCFVLFLISRFFHSSKVSSCVLAVLIVFDGFLGSSRCLIYFRSRQGFFEVQRVWPPSDSTNLVGCVL